VLSVVILRIGSACLVGGAGWFGYGWTLGTIQAVAKIVSIDLGVLTSMAMLLVFHVRNLVIREMSVLTIVEPHVGGAIGIITPSFAWRRWPCLTRSATWRQLVIQIQVGGAAILTLPAVLGVNGVFALISHVNIVLTSLVVFFLS
jgi:hypothetical protein